MKHDAKRLAGRGWRSVGLTLFCALALLSLGSTGCFTPRYYDSDYPRYYHSYYPFYFFRYYRVHHHRPPPHSSGHHWNRWDRERWDWQHQRWEHQHEQEHRPQHDR